MSASYSWGFTGSDSIGRDSFAAQDEDTDNGLLVWDMLIISLLQL